MAGFIPDTLQNISNFLYTASGGTLVTPELGWTESAGGADVNPNHVVTPNLDLTSGVWPGNGSNVRVDNTGQKDGGGTTYGGTPAYSAADLASLNQAESIANNSLGRIDVQLKNALANIADRYGISVNELKSSFNANRRSYDDSSTQNAQNLRSNKNVIADQASQGLRGLQRMLGAFGAVGSDLGLAGGAVANQASQQRAGANQNFAQNQRALDTNWGNYQIGYDNENKKLEDWRTQQEQATRQSALTNKQSLLQQLAQLKQQRASLLGGSEVDAKAFLDRANALSGEIDGLGRINPTYRGNTPVYTAAPLSTYTNNGSPVVTTDNGATAAGNTPFLSLLLGNQKDKRVIY